jgi:hypothetical protein
MVGGEGKNEGMDLRNYYFDRTGMVGGSSAGGDPHCVRI